ncbi:hypothetical protein KL86DES1_10781 [uncultured Desulfovibrio sp.]|uniref:Uncharacterized protein n=1 Tax=uncultured Desulfovibrio sp. TaxID=167968 RepID=A0A212L0B8_9BACT|nr:hypothetical protein KL86DES1_10781 [uncultured Desulfovibrio sp.]
MRMHILNDRAAPVAAYTVLAYRAHSSTRTQPAQWPEQFHSGIALAATAWQPTAHHRLMYGALPPAISDLKLKVGMDCCLLDRFNHIKTLMVLQCATKSFLTGSAGSCRTRDVRHHAISTLP